MTRLIVGIACVLLVVFAVPVARTGGDASAAPDAAAPSPLPGSPSRPPAAEASPAPAGAGGIPVRDAPPLPDPEVGPPTADRAAVARLPAFVRGAARSGDGLIAASRGRTCAVRPDGGVTCWGRDGIRERLSAAALEGAVGITSGDHPHQELHVCALAGNGTVSCWGSGVEGQLGRGTTLSSYLPARVWGVHDAVALAAGSDHTCAVHAGGEVSCWGSGLLGQLGDGSGASAARPRRVPGLADARRIDAGATSTCVIDSAGTLRCWGLSGGAGAGDSFEPTEVSGLPPVASVSIGRDRTCAVGVAGSVYCWPSAEGREPLPIAGLEDVVTVAVGYRGACAVHEDGGVSCWGGENAAGQLGNGTTAPQPRPARVAGIADAVAVSMSAGSSRIAPHTCVAHGDGSYTCWGGNGFGQLGGGGAASSPLPVPVVVPDGVPADRVPTDSAALLRAWLDEVVRTHEAVFPWLRSAWDHVRDRIAAPETDAFRGRVRTSCSATGGTLACDAASIEIAEMVLATAVHELAHVYDATTELVAGRAWGAVQLYFATTYPDCFVSGGQQPGSEILADTMTYLLVPTAWLTYHAGTCPGLGGRPDREALEVVRAGLAGVVPAWYTENITGGAELWAALRPVLSEPLLANLAAEFGGFCSTGWFGFPVDRSAVPAARTNPFRDGGC